MTPETEDVEEKAFNYAMGILIKSWRIERGWSQQILARKMKIPVRSLQQYEKGGEAVSMRQFIHVCRLLKLEFILPAEADSYTKRLRNTELQNAYLAQSAASKSQMTAADFSGASDQKFSYWAAWLSVFPGVSLIIRRLKNGTPYK